MWTWFIRSSRTSLANQTSSVTYQYFNSSCYLRTNLFSLSDLPCISNCGVLSLGCSACEDLPTMSLICILLAWPWISDKPPRETIYSTYWYTKSRQSFLNLLSCISNLNLTPFHHYWGSFGSPYIKRQKWSGIWGSNSICDLYQRSKDEYLISGYVQQARKVSSGPILSQLDMKLSQVISMCRDNTLKVLRRLHRKVMFSRPLRNISTILFYEWDSKSSTYAPPAMMIKPAVPTHKKAANHKIWNCHQPRVFTYISADREN